MKLECFICKKVVNAKIKEQLQNFICGKCRVFHFNQSKKLTVNISTSQSPPITLKVGELTTGRIEF